MWRVVIVIQHFLCWIWAFCLWAFSILNLLEEKKPVVSGGAELAGHTTEEERPSFAPSGQLGRLNSPKSVWIEPHPSSRPFTFQQNVMTIALAIDFSLRMGPSALGGAIESMFFVEWVTAGSVLTVINVWERDLKWSLGRMKRMGNVYEIVCTYFNPFFMGKCVRSAQFSGWSWSPYRSVDRRVVK